LAGSGDATYDRSGLRALLLPHARAGDPELRLAALYALYRAGAQPEDLDLVLETARDPATQAGASHLIFTFTEGDLTGKAGEAVLALLSLERRETLRSVLQGLWGAKVSPEIEKRILALAKTESRGDAIYFGLSTLRDKSPAVVDELIRAVDDPDWNVSWRAVWGLSHGVGAESRSRVADFLLEAFEARSDKSIREYAFEGLKQSAGRAQLEAIERLAANELLSEAWRVRFRELAAGIREATKGGSGGE
jgi:HEAT repeat protein